MPQTIWIYFKTNITIVKPLTLLINEMLSTRMILTMKLYKVIPLFKINDTKDLANYRSISLLTSVSIFFEKLSMNNYTLI